MSWIDFEFELERDYSFSEIVNVLTLITDCGGIDRVKEKLRLMRNIDNEIIDKYNSLEKKFEQLEQKHKDSIVEYSRFIHKLLMELRDYAHRTYVCVSLDEISDIIVYRPYEGDIFKTDFTYHFFIVAKGYPRELLYAFDKMLPINEICGTLIDVILKYYSMEVKKQ